jgi:hypothetical protein
MARTGRYRYTAPAKATELDAPISLPTRGGRIDLRNAPASMKCATGCKTMGGGFLLASVFDDDGTLKGNVPLCGNCLALAIVGRIEQVKEARDAR